MSDDSRPLLERYCRQGDQAAFSSFYRSQADRLWRYLRSRGCAPDAAYDVLGEAFLRFIEVVCRDLRYPVGLLYRIAINLSIDHHRREDRSPLVADDNAIENTAAADTGHETEGGYLRALMATLPENEQNLLLMRYWIGMSHKEIAMTLEKPQGTVRRQCAAALQMLRQRWENDNG